MGPHYHVVMVHHNLNWATMVTHYMRAHNQWLCMACQGVEETHLVSFRKVSRNFWREYDRKMRDWCHHSYTRARSKKHSLFSRVASTSVQRHLENQAARLGTLSNRWLTGTWCQKEHRLATESDIVRRLVLKRKRVPSPGGVHGKHPCTNPQGDSCEVQLTGSPLR